MLTIFVLGISSGFPWVMIGSAMSAWLKEAGFSRTDIGFFGLVAIAYSINFFWSPLVDRLRIPILTRALGQRRSWIASTQTLVAVFCALIAFTDVASGLLWVKAMAFMLAVFAATQDIAIDAYRIDVIPDGDGERMSAASACATAGWWTGYAGLGVAPFILTDRGFGWQLMYLGMAITVVILIILTVLLAREPDTLRESRQRESDARYAAIVGAHSEASVTALVAGAFVAVCGGVWMILGMPGLVSPTTATTLGALAIEFIVLAWILRRLFAMEATVGQEYTANALVWHQKSVAWILSTFVEPLADFFRRNGVQVALSILLFILLFKVGEAFLGRMSIVFYKEVGFTNAQIGEYSKAVNWWVTIVFSALGGLVNVRFGLFRGLLTGGIAMAASNLMFAWIAVVGPDTDLLVWAVIVDGFTTAWSSVAFVAFLSVMCNRAFTATQYALMASLGTLARTMLASASGLMVDKLEGNWPLFFCLTSLMVIPGLLLLTYLRRKLPELSVRVRS